VSDARISVMYRPTRGHAPSGYRRYGEYETFTEAADIVHALRRLPTIAWAYIPDEYASFALDTSDPQGSPPSSPPSPPSAPSDGGTPDGSQ